MIAAPDVQEAARLGFPAWCAARRRELQAPESCVGWVGLYPLQPGRNEVGADSACAVPVPGVSGCLGYFDYQPASSEGVAAEVCWYPVGGAVRRLRTDREGAPDVLEFGSFRLHVVDRDGHLAVRLRDFAWAERCSPPELQFFEFDPAWCFLAAWEPLAEPVTVWVPKHSGEVQAVAVGWQAVFQHGGDTLRLLPMSVAADHAFFVFRDQTCGRESYGAGRFLRANVTVDGQILLDFNRAYNPPCAFTPWATCPLPPPENRLPCPVRAGEYQPA